MRCVSLLAVLLLAGCAPLPVRPVEVRVPVPVPCVAAGDIPPQPVVSTDGELRAMGDYRLVLTLARERLLLLGYSDELRAVLSACAR